MEKHNKSHRCGKNTITVNLHFNYNVLSLTCTTHLKTPIASKISDKILLQKDAQARILLQFLNSIKFSFRS